MAGVVRVGLGRERDVIEIGVRYGTRKGVGGSHSLDSGMGWGRFWEYMYVS